MSSNETEIMLSKQLFVEHGKAIESILRRGIDQTLLRHRRLGDSIAIWKDGKVVIIPPEEIRTSAETSSSTD